MNPTTVTDHFEFTLFGIDYVVIQKILLMKSSSSRIYSNFSVFEKLC